MIRIRIRASSILGAVALLALAAPGQSPTPTPTPTPTTPPDGWWPDITVGSVRAAASADLDRLVRALGTPAPCDSLLRFARLGDSRGGAGDWWMTCYGCIAVPVARVIPYPMAVDLAKLLDSAERRGLETSVPAIGRRAGQCD